VVSSISAIGAEEEEWRRRRRRGEAQDCWLTKSRQQVVTTGGGREGVFVIAVADVFISSFNDNGANKQSQIKIKFFVGDTVTLPRLIGKAFLGLRLRRRAKKARKEGKNGDTFCASAHVVRPQRISPMRRPARSQSIP